MVRQPEGLSVLLEQGALAATAILNSQGSLQKTAQVQRPVAPAGDLPVKEPDLAAGQQIGVADMRVTMQQGLRRCGQRSDVGLPDRLDERVDSQ